MNKQAVVAELLKASQRSSGTILGQHAAAAWMGQSQTFQPQLNEAIATLVDTGNHEPLVAIIELFVSTGLLTDIQAKSYRDILESKEN